MENYPQLKADENVLKLQEELTTTENQIAFARQAYNDVVLELNTRIQSFPTNLIADNFGFKAAEYFKGAPEDAGRSQGRSFDDAPHAARLSTLPQAGVAMAASNFRTLEATQSPRDRAAGASHSSCCSARSDSGSILRARDVAIVNGHLVGFPVLTDCGAGVRRRAIDGVVLQRRVAGAALGSCAAAHARHDQASDGARRDQRDGDCGADAGAEAVHHRRSSRRTRSRPDATRRIR